MELSGDKIKVKDLLELKRNNMLTVNAEYQRGSVWLKPQQKKLIDSVLRGYPLPLIYLHYKKRMVAGMQREDLEIIDGQQRINALYEFAENTFKLFDPIVDDKVARFPNFIKLTPCPWAGKDFIGLPDDLKEKFSNTELFIVKVVTDNEDEARDLFIRLQAGLPLNAQEKRDAWPGGFTEFILNVAGKENNPRFPGHNVFQKLLSKSNIDRGQHRQLCAQIAMLVFEKATNHNWCDIDSNAIDDYYYKNLGFDPRGKDAQRFIKILDKIDRILFNRGIKRLKGHELIHLVLITEQLIAGYTPSWEGELLNALVFFRAECTKAKKTKSTDYWDKYVQWTMTSANSKSSITVRHVFFTKVMYSQLKPQCLDKTRIFAELEREILYYKYLRKCQVCYDTIDWDDLEIHHLIEHQRGGQTVLDNGVPVHRICHPKGQDAVDFYDKIDLKQQNSLT